ncbi:glycosyltransferase [Aureimonas phyllosphaerae]|uniref:glycosyltransferase n=1 Tax=Aureimonas phyllosphaerae TaxID=1166078 RepID=UPI003A5BD43C
MRGGEKVVEELCRMFPDAEIFTLVCDREKLSPLLQSKTIHTSFLQRIPTARRNYTKMLPLMPFALEQFDLQAFDLVISSESGPAKAVITRPDALHICYCHSPMRYIWDHFHVYQGDLGRVGRFMMNLFAPLLRIWDVTTSARVDAFAANSAHVGRRIRKFYRRDSMVVHPPVAVQDFDWQQPREDFYLCAGQIVGYKRVDIAVEAFTKSGRRLIVIGEGPQRERLQRIAGSNIVFTGYQSFPVLRDHLQRCRALIFPGEEDFGILPVEAMAAGAPVIAFDSGGARETVTPETGVRFKAQTIDSLNDAIDRFEASQGWFNPQTIRAHAETFGPEKFRRNMIALIESALHASRGGMSIAPAAKEQDTLPGE